jgi:nitrogen regulatory protein P-II 2
MVNNLKHFTYFDINNHLINSWHVLCITSNNINRYKEQWMKLVTVIIKPFKLEEVRESLSNIGITGLTVTEVKGFGRQKGHAELYRGAEYNVNFLPKVKIELAISDELLDEAISTITKAAYTGKIGDGKIFVTSLDHVVRIRTGETDESAL